MPSSAVAVKVVLPPAKLNDPVQRAEKPSIGTEGSGLPSPQSLFRGAFSQRLTTGEPERVMFEKYCAWYWPAVQEEPAEYVAV